MARLSREESRAQTRERLLAAAEDLFAEKGMSVGLEEIAEAAGFSRGAVYYNFSDKTELFSAVLEKRSQQQIAQVADLFNATDDTADLFVRIRARTTELRGSEEVRRWALLSGEFWLAAARDPIMRARLDQRMERLRAAYASAITIVLDRLGIAAPLPIPKLAALLLAIDDGLSRQQWVGHGDIEADLFVEVMEFLLRAAVALDPAARPT